jgi:CRP-like cAMP-binding protein
MDPSELDGLDALVVMPAVDRAILSQHMERITVRSGETLIHRGRPGGTAYLLLDGNVQTRVEEADRRGRCTYTGVIPVGEWFGVVSLLDGGPATADVVALSDLQVAALTRASFDQLLQHTEGTGARLLRTWLRSVAIQLSRVNAGNVRMLTLAAAHRETS